ncbi:unnamed protein product [Cyclocybe aegerita]|uniref:Thioredoxin-like fold domain-containing protein n=1 Tax=Cyclocybe aegerita TaxID=1973307 RepID=A0A8S0VTE8_CYCAE|nr:unnamed protein product [Cyclocybe aegerita]
MKLSALALLALASTAHAQYFSAGWTPGQKPHDTEPAPDAAAQDSSPSSPPPPPANAAPFSFSSLFDINKLLTSEPAVSLFSKFGVNITEKVHTALETKLWDDRVELITDDNFKELIVEEKLTPEQEQKRTWIIVVSVTSARQDGVSKYLDQVFDSAFNQTQLAGDLPDVKWGRIDYLNVTYITTKWGIWQAPYLVVLRDRGQSLRFYRPYQIRLREDALREFLKNDGWKVSPPWSSSFAPGGDNEYIMDFLATCLTKIYNLVVLVPKWVLLLASGSLASVIIGLLHRPSQKKVAKKPKAKPEHVAVPASGSGSGTEKAGPSSASVSKSATPAPAVTDSERESSAPPGKRQSARQRKNKK